MHHLAFGINFQIHFIIIIIISSVLSRFTSSFTCQLVFVIIPTLIIHHSFTLSLQAQNLPFQQILTTLIDFFYPLDFLFQIMGLDRTYHAYQFIFSFFLLHFCSFRMVDCADYTSAFLLMHVKYRPSYRIVSYRSQRLCSSAYGALQICL